MTIQLKNNAVGFLSAGVSATATLLVLQSGEGAKFPALVPSQFFYVTLASTSGATEIVKVTGRSGDSLTVQRAQENTTAMSFPALSRVELRVTAQAVYDVIDAAIVGTTTAVSNIASVIAVAASIDSVNTVTSNLASVINVSNNIGDINLVENSLTNVNAVAANMADVNAVADDLAAVNAVADDIDDLVTNLEDIVAVGGSINSVVTVANNIASVNAVNSNSTNVNTVAGSIGNVNTVATNIAAVQTVSTNIASVNAVNSNSANVNTVAGSIANVNTTATNIASVNTAATNIVAIQTAPAQATAAANSASAAATSATNAAASATAAAASAVTAVNAPGTSGTSTTSLTIGTGSQTFTTQTAKAWVVGQFVTVASTASPTNFMYGQITAYNSGTGSMTVNVLSVGGSGTLASWTIGLVGPNATLTDQHSLQPVALTLPAIRPSLLLDFANSKKLDPRITFTRATSATYYDGVTSAKAEENLLLRSQEFDNGYWSKNALNPFGSGSVANTTDTLDPIGGNTADYIQENNTNNVHFVDNSSAVSAGYPAGTYSFSVYAKLKERTVIAISVAQQTSTNWAASTFDLSSGQVSQSGSGSGGLVSLISSSITNAGSGWYRCVLTVSSTIACYPTIQIADSATYVYGGFGRYTYTGDGTSGVYIWGAQLEQRSAATVYTPTTTQPITNYVPQLLTAPANTPRFDHNPVTGESLGLLVEEQRTNLLTYSEEFNNAAWSFASQVTVVANAAVAPNGTTTADRIQGTGTGWYLGQTVSLVLGTSYVLSMYVRSNTGSAQTFRLFSASGSNASGNLTATANWQLFTYTFTFAGGGNDHGIFRDSSNNTADLLIWGAQLEAGAFATSYIPTGAASVTRSADLASMTGVNFSSWYRPDRGSLYFEATGQSGLGSFYPAMITGAAGNTANGYYMTTQLVIPSRSDGSNGWSNTNVWLSTGYVANQSQKFMFAFENGSCATVNNGAVIETNTEPLAQVTPAVLTIGASFTGRYKKLAYYPTRLTNAQLQALTA